LSSQSASQRTLLNADHLHQAAELQEVGNHHTEIAQGPAADHVNVNSLDRHTSDHMDEREAMALHGSARERPSGMDCLCRVSIAQGEELHQQRMMQQLGSELAVQSLSSHGVAELTTVPHVENLRNAADVHVDGGYEGGTAGLFHAHLAVPPTCAPLPPPPLDLSHHVRFQHVSQQCWTFQVDVAD